MTRLFEKKGYLYEVDGRIVFAIEGSKHAGFYSFHRNDGLEKLTKIVFKETLIGENYQKIESQLKSNIKNYILTKGQDGNLYFSYYQEDKIIGFDKNGNKQFEWVDTIGQGHAIYDVQFQAPNHLWLAYPTGQTITQIDLTTGKEIYRVGEYTYKEIYEPLCYPESLFVSGENLYVANMGKRQLLALNLLTKKLKIVHTFEGRVWQYLKLDFGEFAVLESGIYQLT